MNMVIFDVMLCSQRWICPYMYDFGTPKKKLNYQFLIYAEKAKFLATVNS
jgi:hypothetical protein